ncbi:MAG: diguanylate cyclase [Mariprofundaceae bacterium]|nr:diguanylate cyclase [Mariprofundaceae bacterium]
MQQHLEQILDDMDILRPFALQNQENNAELRSTMRRIIQHVEYLQRNPSISPTQHQSIVALLAQLLDAEHGTLLKGHHDTGLSEQDHLQLQTHVAERQDMLRAIQQDWPALQIFLSNCQDLLGKAPATKADLSQQVRELEKVLREHLHQDGQLRTELNQFINALQGSIGSVLHVLDEVGEDAPELKQTQSILQHDLPDDPVEAKALLQQAREGLVQAGKKLSAASQTMHDNMQQQVSQMTDLSSRLKEAEHAARKDPLTGLANRRKLAEYLTSLPQGISISFVMIDIDFFKKVNDRYGHEELAEKFYALDVEILRTLDVATFCSRLPQQVAELFGVPQTWLTFIDDSKAARFVRGKGETLLVKRDNFVALFPQPDRPLVANENLAPYFMLLPPARREHFRSLALVPLHLDGELVGSLNQADPDPRRFNPDYNPIYLERLAVKLSIGLSNVIAHEQLQHLAYHDPLTALPNRRAMERFLNAELARVKRYGGEISVAFLDLDRLKVVNDSHGHDYGDALLKYLADGLNKMSRQTDLCTRLAGDEFVLLLPQTDRENAEGLLARMVAQFFKSPLKFKGQSLKVSISYGIASSQEEQHPAALLKLADSRLYEIKRRKKSI